MACKYYIDGMEFDRDGFLGYVKTLDTKEVAKIFPKANDANGNKVLFLEEVQSDWGQKGKKEGFRTDELPLKKSDLSAKKVDEVDGTTYWDIYKDNLVVARRVHGGESQISQQVIDMFWKVEETSRLKPSTAGQPSAPFVTDTNAWTKLGLKVALKEAVKQGADKIAWTTGEQQNDRYDLSKSVDGLEYQPQRDGKYDVFAHKGDNNIFYEKGIDLKRIEDVFGKDIADKISKNEGTKATYDPNKFYKRLEGDGLKVGGKGMKGFYGSPTEGSLGIVGNVAKSLFKQEPKTIKIEIAKKDEYTLGEANYVGGIGVYDGNGDMVSEFDTKAEANKYIIERSGGTQHSIDITPELKASVEGGQPLFKDAEAQYRIESGKNIIEAIKDFNKSKNKARATVALTHEIMHPTVETIITGAKEGNAVGQKHTKTIVEEYNKANPDNKVTEEELIADNDKFVNGETTDKYRAVQEFIAEQWERYHQEGAKGFSKSFQEVLDAISEAFRSVYKSLTGKELTPELRKMFDDILGKEELSTDETTPTKEVSNEGNSALRDVEAQKADIKIGKVSNTEYEVKSDGVYYKDKKLDNPKNLSHKELITEDIRRRKKEELNAKDKQSGKFKKDLDVYIIEKRRIIDEFIKNKGENLESIDGWNDLRGDIQELLFEGKFDEAKAKVPQTYEEKINAKYDAELEALSKPNTNETTPTKEVSSEGNPALRAVESTAKALEGVDTQSLKKQLDIEANWDMIGEGDALSGKDAVLAYTQKQLPEWNRESQLGNINPNSKLTYDIVRGQYGGLDQKNIAEAKDENGVTIAIAKLDDKGGVEHIAVAPEFRGKGVADNLIKVLKENNPNLDLSKTKLRSKGFEKAFGNKIISEAYHKAKADGSNPELVKAVEELLGKPTEKPKTETTPTVSSEVVSGSALKDVVRQESDAEKLNKEAGVDIYVARQDIDTNGGKYTLSQIKENGNTNTFLIEDAKGNEVGKAQLSANGNYLENIRIDEKHRRKGLASKVYDFIELRKGIELEPSPNKQSKEAKALWDKRNLQKSVSNKANGGLLAKALGESMSKTFADFRNKQQVLLELENKYFEQKGLSKEEFNKLSENEKSEIIKDAIKWKNDNPELVKAVEQLLGKPKETSPTPNSKGEGTEVKYQIEEFRDEPLSSVNPALAEYIRQRMQRLFPSVALFSDKASFEAAAKKVSKGVTFSSAYIGAAIKNMVYVDAEKSLQHTEIHEYAHIYWDALPADHPLKVSLLEKFGGNEEAAIDAIGRAGTIIMENELDIAKSGFFEKWLKKFWAAVKGVFTSKSIEQAFAERLLTNADLVTEENIANGVVKYMKMKSSAKYSELSEKAVKGIEKIIGKKISSLTFPEYYKHISTEIKPNDFKQWKMLSPQKFLEKMYGIVSPVSTLSPSNKAVFMKQYREYLDDYNWAENNVWTRFASGSMTLTVKEIEDLYMEAYKRKSYGTKDAVNFLADLYSKAVMYKNMQQEIKGDTFNKPFAKMSFDMMSGHEITDLSGSEFVSGKYSLLSPDRVKETILQGREKLYREVQRNATIKEDALKNDFDAIWKKVKDLKSDLHKIVDKTGKYFIDRNSSAYKALRSGTVADRALADLLDMHYKYESAYGGLSMEKGKYRVPVARMDFGGLAKKFGFKEGMRRYFAKPSKYDNVIIDVRSLGLSKPLMTLKQARQEMVKGSNAIYPFQMLKLTKKVDALTKEAYKQFNSGRHANGDIVTTEDLSGSRYGVSFVKDDESSEDLKVSMMLYHYANIENESYDLLSPYSMYIQKYLGRKDKPNMLKWVKMLDDDLIKGESPTSNLGVYAKYVQALTNYTHWLQLGFNIAGMPFNAFAGFAQSVREIGFRNTLRGLRRVIGSLTVGGGAGVVNAKAISIMEKLHIVSLSKDLEMSVTSKIGKGISKIAFLPVSFVEYINHAYSFIGAMDESEWERVKALPANASAEDYTKAMGGNERIDELHTLTQKINGAYSKYSRRGINKTAEGRALMQFKNWLPDVIFAHLTVSQLNEAGEDLYGEYQSGIATSIKNTVWNKTIIPMFKDKSIAQAKKNWETLSEHEQMQVGKAMRQLVILGGMALWIASLDDRDDKELKRMLRRAMGDVTYIFDVSNMQFLFDNTVPVFGTIKNLLGLVAEVFSTATGNPSVYEKRQGSHMRGDLKLPVMIENQTPVVNKISKLVNEKD